MSDAAVQTQDEQAMAALLVEALNLEGVAPETIAPEAPLFGQDDGSLGLDSIDALEIALAIQTRHGVELRSDDPDNRRMFASLRALTAHVQQRRGG